jgi:hypothetical protein
MLPKIVEAIQAIAPALPEGSSLYLFGSASRSDDYADIDLLILYDPSLCPASQAHHNHRALVRCVAEIGNGPVHLCLLSYHEDSVINFRERVSAVQVFSR